ncbi:MAG: hypothetical protein GEU73_10390 [Chloroflexi bacterium]|nr:hypothetical protein [Chloroflexota bacterium]
MAQTDDLHVKMVLPPAPWTRALADGRVRIPGVTYECNTGIEDAPGRFVASSSHDVGENGVRRLVLDHLRGAPPTAIPVFFGREHMQRNIFVRQDSSLTHARQLVGKRVGSWLTPHSGTGAGVLMMLEQGYEIPLTEVDWRLGDPASLPTNRMGLRLSRGPDSVAGTFEALRSGDLDAIIVTLRPRHWSLFGPDLLHFGRGDVSDMRPLIADPHAIADIYRRTGLYPITDLAVVTPDLVQRHPELPAGLVEALSEANTLAAEYMGAEEAALARQEVNLLGEDPHRHGLGSNARHNVATFVDFLYRLGAFDRPVESEQLFVPGIQ